MTRRALTRVWGPAFTRSIDRPGAVGHQRAESGAVDASGGRRRGARYLASAALALGLLATNVAGALAFDPQPIPPGGPHASVQPSFDPKPIPPGGPHASVQPSFDPKPIPPGGPHATAQRDGLPPGLRAALAHPRIATERGA